jgi:hypothetical protein
VKFALGTILYKSYKNFSSNFALNTFQQDGEILAFLGRNDVCGDSHWKETKVRIR